MMTASLTPTLINTDFQNWLKGALAVLFAKEGLIDLVGHEIIDFQRHVLQTVYTQKGIPPGNTCSSCTTANVLACPTAGFCSKGKRCKAHDSKVPDKKPNQACPLCSHIRDAIKNEHRFNGPSWKNTDARKWCSDAFELSKCFMPPDGYSDKTSLAETDFNGILAVVINNNRFQKTISVNLGVEPNICTEARVIGREIRHTANHSLSDQDLIKYIDGLITLLSDPAYLAADVKAKDAVEKLKQLKTNTLTIHADDITNVLNESVKTTFEDQQKSFLRDIQEHFKNHRKDSVKAIDRKIQELVDRQLAELKEETNRGKDELYVEIGKGKAQFRLQNKTDKDELQTQLEQGKNVLKTYTKRSKDELQTQLEQGKDLLSTDTKHIKDELQTQLEMGKNALNTHTKKGKDELQTQIEHGKDILNTEYTMANFALRAHTKTVEHKLNDLEESIVLYTRTVDNEKHKGIEELQEVTNTGKQALEVQSKDALEQINRSVECAKKKKTPSGFLHKITFKELRLRSELRKELILFYIENESTIPASPLVEDHAVPLTDLYVQPPMSAFIRPAAFGTGNTTSVKMPVSTYRELFLNDENVLYKNIYVEADAGYGKTSFAKKVAMTWCQAKKANKSLKSKFIKKDVDTLKCFDFLFLLHLRDFQSEDICNLDDLILKFVSKNLPDKEHFSKTFIVRILQSKTCLVIIDGLDEWVHPDNCMRTPGIPHNNYREKCTVLTTTRPWKLSAVGLPPNLIDRHLEISALDEKTSNELKSNALNLLSQIGGEGERDLTDFDTKVSLVQLGDIRFIPYILLQLICIWFDGLSIGGSKCETYSNTIELTLERGLKKKSISILPSRNTERNVTVPECTRHNALCNQYVNLLLKLGELAFYTLFQKLKESSLVIENTTVLKFLNEQDFEFCLKIGLLSQTNDSSKVSVKRYKVFFQHKSVQEFMAAFYITSEWNNGTIKSTILEVCTSLSSILEMANLFVFVCGMNPVVYTCISGELQRIIDHDPVTRRYRTEIYCDHNEAWRLMESYQTMQVQCLQESVRNGNETCLIHLHDILTDKYTRLSKEDLISLKTIINFNKCKVKSLQQSDLDRMTVFMQSLDPGVFTSLETLRSEFCEKEPVWLADILHESASTLKCLSLAINTQSIINVTSLTGLICLESLYLAECRMTQSDLKFLYAYISQTTTLTQLKLWAINYSDNKYGDHDCDVTFDLHRLNKLKMLYLAQVPLKELYVNTACLEKLEIRKLVMTAIVTLWKDLRAAPVLSSLTLDEVSFCQEMTHTIPTLTELRFLGLEHVKLSEVTVPSAAWRELFLSVGNLPRGITVKLVFITMATKEWKELLLSVGQLPNPVTVELFCCQESFGKTWDTIVNAIKSTPTLSLLPDLSIVNSNVYLTLTNTGSEIPKHIR